MGQIWKQGGKGKGDGDKWGRNRGEEGSALGDKIGLYGFGWATTWAVLEASRRKSREEGY